MTRRELLKTLINQVLVFSGFAALFAGPVCYLWMGTLSIWWLFVWLPLLILMHLARLKMRNFALFALLHFTWIAFPVLLLRLNLLSPMTFAGCLLLSVVTAVFSFYYRFHMLPSPYVLTWPGCVAALVCAVTTVRFPAPGLMAFESVCVILLLGFTPLLRQMESLDESIQVLEKHHTSMTKAQLLRHNNRLALLYTLFIIAITGTAPLLAQGSVTRLIGWLGRLLYDFIQFLFSLLPEGTVTAPPPSMTPLPEDDTMQELLVFQKEDSLLSHILGWVWNILSYATLLVIVVGGFYAAIRIVMYLYRRFQSTRKTDGDLIESLGKKILRHKKATSAANPALTLVRARSGAYGSFIIKWCGVTRALCQDLAKRRAKSWRHVEIFRNWSR